MPKVTTPLPLRPEAKWCAKRASANLGRISNWSEQGFEHYLDCFYTKWAVLTRPSGPILGALAEAGSLADH